MLIAPFNFKRPALTRAELDALRADPENDLAYWTVARTAARTSDDDWNGYRPAPVDDF